MQSKVGGGLPKHKMIRPTHESEADLIIKKTNSNINKEKKKGTCDFFFEDIHTCTHPYIHTCILIDRREDVRTYVKSYRRIDF